MAAPTNARSAATWRSAADTSGRRRMSESGLATATSVGSAGIAVYTAQLLGQLSRRAADQDADLVLRRRHLVLRVGNRRQREAELGARALGIECRAAAGVEPLLGHLQRPPLVLGVAAGHGQPLLRAAQLEVVPRQLRRERDLHVAQVLAGGADERALALHVPADPAEQIELPRGVETAVPDVLVRERARRRSGTWRSRAAGACSSAAP